MELTLKKGNILQQTMCFMCLCMCICLCVCMCVCVCDCLCVGKHYKIISFCKRNYGKIISNVSAFISPIRLRNLPGDLLGVRARVSGWGRISDSKYIFIIIVHFNLKNCSFQNESFSGEETHNFQKILWSL
jgi:hypothetical protein